MTDRRIVLALVVLAISARVAAIFILGGHEVRRGTYEHGEIAANLLAGRGFSVKYLGGDGPTSQQAPIYPVAVAAAYALGGVGTPRALLILELGQAALGGVLVALIIMLTSEVAPGRSLVAYLSGLIVAVHPTLVYAATHVQVASLVAVLLTLCMAYAYRSGRTGRIGDAVGSGVALAALVLTDPILGLALFGMAWAILRGLGWREAVRPLVIVGATCAVAVAPWVVRNARVHGEFVPVKSSFGYAFWQGNCALSEGTDKVVRPSVDRILKQAEGGSLRARNEALWQARHEAGCIDDIALTRSDYREMAAMTEPARSRYLFALARDDLAADPGRYPRLCLRRLGYFVLFDETNPKTRNRLYRVSHLGLTALAMLGLVFAPRDLRRRLGPTFLAAALIAAFHALTIVSARFHLPIEPLMALWAASGVARFDQPREPM